MSDWLRVNKSLRCPVCDKPDWCLISTDGKVAICARVESKEPAGNKGAGWLHKIDTIKPLTPLKHIQNKTRKAAPHILDIAYRALLTELQLSPKHREELNHRGLTDEEISKLGYKTLPACGRSEIATQLNHQEIALAGVPGFYYKAGQWQLAGPAGIAMPVKDTRIRIIGIQVRCDVAENGKYKWLSSRNYNAGCSPCAPIHVAGQISINSELWITEGPLKADIASLKLNRLVLAVPGVGNWPGVIPIIRELRPERVIIAFDMDKVNNHAVKLHRNALVKCLISRGVRTFEADWDINYKGLDDLLIQGAVNA